MKNKELCLCIVSDHRLQMRESNICSVEFFSGLVEPKLKKKHWLRQEIRGEVCPSWSFKEGDVPWILKKDDLSLEMEVIMNLGVPYLYGSSLRCCFIVEDHLSGLKLHDHLNLLRVCMSKT